MARPSTLPPQVFDHAPDDHAPDQALAHLPTELPPSPTSPDVTLPQHALDAVEHINTLGVNHLPDFFS
ncbi:hypothetical protein [Bradyrhizobium ivorense]|uniref:hypothetical protein n=1 Tax=Bradyrhizobium ivorense TaxID=2511166 RepID=UPI0010B5F85F|nr:hypothetical protein [Bradyrhizobium ivorense]VIO68800.1 hypothetical protein CI41S_16010 [Bradyrhizobium ivorense]